MAEHPAQMLEARRPAVNILTAGSASAGILNPVLWGLEEEGIPFELQPAAEQAAVSLAKRAADASALGVGVGIHDGEQTVVLHHRDLPAERPLFSLSAAQLQALPLRVLGMNAARLAKGQPLVFIDGGVPKRTEKHPGTPLPGAEMERLVQIVTGVVLELLQTPNLNRQTGR